MDVGEEKLVVGDKELAEVLVAVQKLDERATQLRSTLNQDYALIDELVKEIARQKKAFTEWKQANAKTTNLPADSIKAQRRISAAIDKLNKDWKPETGSLFVRFFLGQVNVKQYRDGERNILKLEYEKFKERTNAILLVLVLIQLFFFRGYRIIEIGFQVWLLYYYISLALRENILKVNGSNIKSWWIIHHYISILACFVFIIMPVTMYERWQTPFLYFFLFQSMVQNLMNRYQSAHLYKQIAMGRANRMDGDAVSPQHLSWAPTAIVLLPFLLAFQVSQLVMGYLLLRYFHTEVHTWHPFLGGIIFLLLGLGNIYTTLITYIQNRLFSKKSKQ